MVKKRLGRPPLSAAEKARRAAERAALKGTAPKRRGRKPGFKLKIAGKKRGRPVGYSPKKVNAQYPNLIADLTERVCTLEKNWQSVVQAQNESASAIRSLVERLDTYFGTQQTEEVVEEPQDQVANG